ncbi:hypothetical protein KJ359_007047 [Pestalotiopsis sp. 9143b]|nr:hypothetical protein KJ359_007047 [Pestalotiopsis sp. 9143b]
MAAGMEWTSLNASTSLLPTWDFTASGNTSFSLPSYDQVETVLSDKGTCCSGLSELLRGKVATSAELAQDYHASLSTFWSTQASSLEPACVVKPTTKEDVAVSVFTLKVAQKLFPGEEGCQFAVRSGGHTPAAGSASITSGMLIDLTSLNHIEVAPDRSAVRIGPGNRWGDVYSALETEGLGTVGRRMGSVGVGGLITGGGISFFSPKYGFVCDNVQNFEVVLASGEIVDANATSNPSLWRALKGGSSNFGIVTSFTLPAFELPGGKIWGGILVLEASHMSEALSAFAEIADAPDYDTSAALIVAAGWQAEHNAWFILSNLEYTEPFEPPGIFDRLTALPSMVNTLRVNSIANISWDMALTAPNGRRQLFATATFRVNEEMLRYIWEVSQDMTKGLETVANSQWAFAIQPIPSVISARSSDSGGNVLGLSEADGNFFNLLLNPAWDHAEDDHEFESRAQEMLEKLEVKAKELGDDHPILYLNYAAPW